MISAGMIFFILLMKMEDYESTDSSDGHDETHIQHKQSEKIFNDERSQSEPKTTSRPFEEGIQ